MSREYLKVQSFDLHPKLICIVPPQPLPEPAARLPQHKEKVRHAFVAVGGPHCESGCCFGGHEQAAVKSLKGLLLFFFWQLITARVMMCTHTHTCQITVTFHISPKVTVGTWMCDLKLQTTCVPFVIEFWLRE